MAKTDSEIIKKAVVGNRVSDGTVIKFDWVAKNRVTYKFAAIYVANKWYITGSSMVFGKTSFGYIEFFEEILSTAIKIEVATDWDIIKDSTSSVAQSSGLMSAVYRSW